MLTSLLCAAKFAGRKGSVVGRLSTKIQEIRRIVTSGKIVKNRKIVTFDTRAGTLLWLLGLVKEGGRIGHLRMRYLAKPLL